MNVREIIIASLFFIFKLMALTRILDNIEFQVGTNITPSLNVPNNAQKVKIVLTRNSWPDIGSEVIKIMAELSFDNGDTWVPLVGFGARGGDYISGGALRTESSVSIGLPSNKNMRIRATINVFTTLNTSVDISFD